MKKFHKQILLLSLVGTIDISAIIAGLNIGSKNKEIVPLVEVEKEIIPEEYYLEKKEATNELQVLNSSNYHADATMFDSEDDIKKMVYATKDTVLTVPDYLSATGVDTDFSIPKNESFEVYDEAEDIYLVKANGTIGYVNKTDVEELTGTFVIVDISDQELKLYKDNKVVLTTPVVTGGVNNPSDEGIFEIYDISHDRYLKGPGYASYVNVMMKYNGGEGLHDAEHFTDENGFSHGWRDSSEFGGETYKSNGSHGCINMLNAAAKEVYNNVSLGNKVLVKK